MEQYIFAFMPLHERAREVCNKLNGHNIINKGVHGKYYIKYIKGNDNMDIRSQADRNAIAMLKEYGLNYDCDYQQNN